jgi:choline dehydrogenase-like flavoprotein
MEFAMTEEVKTDYCMVGGGIAGVILASKLAPFGKEIVVIEQGPRFTEGDRHRMLLRSKETLNDYADDNDEAGVLI